jgi:hypothetical protein
LSPFEPLAMNYYEDEYDDLYRREEVAIEPSKFVDVNDKEV